MEFIQPPQFAQLAQEPAPQETPPGQSQQPADDLELMEFIQPVPQAEAPVAAPAPAGAPDGASTPDLSLMDYIPSMPRDDLLMTTMPIRGFNPQLGVEESAVELAPEPVPYMPQIVEPEAPTPAPVRQPKVPQPLEQPEFDQEFLQYLMMSEFGGPGLR